MKKFILLALLMVGIVPLVRAESSATAYDSKYYSQQVFVQAYNNGTALTRDNVVIIDASQTSTSGNIGAYILPTQVSDSIFIFGVTDESILAGSMGRICIRGPHKVLMNGTQGEVTGQILGSSTTYGKAGWYSTADGTAGGQLGYLLNNTATTDTGDVTGAEFWAWITPRIHK